MSITFLPQTGRESLLYMQQNGNFFCNQNQLLSVWQSQVLQSRQGQRLLFAITQEKKAFLTLLLPDGSLGQRQQLLLPPEALQSEQCFFSQSSTGTHCYFVSNQALYSSDFATAPKLLSSVAKKTPLRFFDSSHPVLGFLSPKRQQMIYLPDEGQTVTLANDGEAILDYSALWQEGVLHLCYLYGTEKTTRLYYRQVVDGTAQTPQLLYTASGLHLTALFCCPHGLFVSAAGQNRLLYTFSQTGGKTFFPVSRHYAPFAAAQKAQCLGASQWGECYLSAQMQVMDTGFFRPAQPLQETGDWKQLLQKKDQTIRALQTELNRQKQAEQNARTQLLQQSAQWSALRLRLEQENISLQQQLAAPAKQKAVLFAAQREETEPAFDSEEPSFDDTKEAEQSIDPAAPKQLPLPSSAALDAPEKTDPLSN